MKSTTSSLLLISVILIGLTVSNANACGPYNPIIPTPDFFQLSERPKRMADYEREENLKLWQSLISERIPLADIEDVVYHSTVSTFSYYTEYKPEESNNLFYIYLNNSHDNEIIDFLVAAKKIEGSWEIIRSPWHYPRSRDHNYLYDETGDFSDLIDFCKKYTGKRLKDRYALQVTRALFASRQYMDCIIYSDSAFIDFPDNNLMKRMAQRYAAGCWNRLGNLERANSLFAQAGDVFSLSTEDPLDYMIRRNPDAPQLIDYIRSHASDTLFMRKVYPKARRLVEKNKVKYPGDWSFILAYIDKEFNQRNTAARKHIVKAMEQKFSSEELKELAHAYRMKLDGHAGYTANLLSDLKWMECMTDVLNRDAKEWIRRCQNIIYVDWIPRLWKNKDYSTAILLCAYADNLDPYRQWYETWQMDCDVFCESAPYNIAEMRESEYCINPMDYACLSFQMMGSLSSAQLASAYTCILYNTPLYNFLRRKARTDKDYYYELIGTLALREENYARAEKYLSKVNEHYLKTMNIDKCRYLYRDPFNTYPSRWTAFQPDYEGAETLEWENSTRQHTYKSYPDAKLKFARKMQEYKQQMVYGRTSDERGFARLMYSIGRRNSFEECWALTQYWRGKCVVIFEPDLQYWEDNFAKKNYDFLYDYEKTVGHKVTEKKYNDDIKAALAMLTTDEAKAKANYILNNLKTIIKYYGGTSTAQYIKTSCDNWKSWL